MSWFQRPAESSPLHQVPAGLGRWGMYEFVEPHVRRLVAEHLAVSSAELVSEVNLRDDLAADSLDLVELAVGLETEFAIAVPERILDGVRTYGDLVHATGLLIRDRHEMTAPLAELSPRIWTRVTPAAGVAGSLLEWAGWLTPYTAATIVEDAVRAGHGARLDVTVAADTDADVARVGRRFERASERGVEVTVRRGDRAAASPFESAADDEIAAEARGGRSSLSQRIDALAESVA